MIPWEYGLGLPRTVPRPGRLRVCEVREARVELLAAPPIEPRVRVQPRELGAIGAEITIASSPKALTG